MTSILRSTAIAAAATLATGSLAMADTSGKSVAFSNSFAGNSFRQVMVDSFERGTAAAREAGKIGDTKVISANGSATEQAAHIQNLILEGYDAIIVNAASPTALNGAIKAACDAGIVVVAFDNTVSEDCAYTVSYVWANYGAIQGAFVGEALGGSGSVLEIRGAAGNSADEEISAGTNAALAKFAGIKVVGSVYGNWTQAIAQREVAGLLPSLGDVDAVVGQGGDGFGAASAFESSGRDLPLIVMGNRYEELKWWQEQRDANGYKTMSLSATPGISMVAFWVAQQILDGKGVPKMVEVPMLVIEDKDLDAWLAATPEGGVANADYTQDWTISLIDANASGGDLPAIPAPTN